MADIFFFTDVDLLSQQPQTIADAFGPVQSFETTKYRITSIHKTNNASNPRAIAICDGTVATQPNSDDPVNLLNLIVKPSKTFFELTGGVNLVPIRYIIYKGITKSSLIVTQGGQDIINSANSNDLCFHLYEIQDAINREKEKISNPPLTTGTITDKPSAKLLKYDVSLTSTDDIGKLFYSGNNIYEIPDVKGGWYIGDFDPNKFGIELVFDELRASSIYENFKATESIILVNAPVNNTQEEVFRKKTEKEQIVSYLDPCAFYGSLHRMFDTPTSKVFSIKYTTSATVIIPGTATTFTDIIDTNDLYNTVLSKFYNKNTIYVDIRNEHNRSFNYQENYADILKVKLGNDPNQVLTDINYYNDITFNQYWPILTLTNPNSFLPNNNTSNVNVIEVLLPFVHSENESPILYLAQGYLDQRFPKNLVGRKKFLNRRRANGPLKDFTKSVSLGIPNISGGNTTPSSCYVRIKYFKKEETQPSSGIAHRNENYFDNLFLPLSMPLSITLPAPLNTSVQVFSEQSYINTEGGESFVASVGVGRDPNNVTFFAAAQERNDRGAFIPVNIPNEAAKRNHFISHVNDKYPQEKLLEGAILDSTSKEYLRFEDTAPIFSRPLRGTQPKLNKHFLSLIIKQSTFFDISTNDGIILPEFDSYLVLKNRTQGVDPISNKKFTKYNLVLRGYQSVSGSLSFHEYDPNVVVYGYGDKNSLILLEDGATTDLYTADETDTPCNSYTVTNADLIDLQSFITELNDPAQLAFKPNKDLSDNLFNNPNGIWVNPPTGTPVNLQKASGFIPTNGFLAEGAYIFAMYRTTKKFDTIISTNAVTDPLYQHFKDALVKNGFKEPENDADPLHTKYIKLLQAHSPRSIGMNVITPDLSDIEKWFFLCPDINDNLKKDLYTLMASGNWSSGTKIFTASEAFTNGSDPNILIYLGKLLNDISQSFYLEVKKEALCIYNKLKTFLGLSTKEPEMVFLATGEGSISSGILNKGSEGLYLFSYQYDERGNVQPNAEKKEFKQRDKTLETVVHISIFGLNIEEGYDPPLVNVSIQYLKQKKTYICSFTTNTNPLNKKKLFSQATPSTKINPASTNAQTVTKYYAKDSGELIAEFDPVKNDLKVKKNDDNYSINVELISGDSTSLSKVTCNETDYSVADSDETQLMVCIVDGEPVQNKVWDLELEDIYPNNRFELTKVQKIDQYLEDDVYAGSASLVDYLLLNTTIASNINIFAKAGNIGLRLDEESHHSSAVARDTRYSFNFARTPLVRKLERSNEEADDKKIRYSYGKVIPFPDEVIILVESYVSQQWARLDVALYNDQTVANISDRIQNINDLDLFTLYGAQQANTITLNSNIKPYVTANKYDNSGTTDLPSYNPVLSAFRCFALLDCIRSIVKKRASDMGKTPTEIANLLSKLDTAIAGVSIDTDFGIGIAKPITQVEFNKFKWYIDATDKNQYGDIP